MVIAKSITSRCRHTGTLIVLYPARYTPLTDANRSARARARISANSVRLTGLFVAAEITSLRSSFSSRGSTNFDGMNAAKSRPEAELVIVMFAPIRATTMMGWSNGSRLRTTIGPKVLQIITATAYPVS